jgi:hypothetical protein
MKIAPQDIRIWHVSVAATSCCQRNGPAWAAAGPWKTISKTKLNEKYNIDMKTNRNISKVIVFSLIAYYYP